jgi:hypothetical protein
MVWITKQPSHLTDYSARNPVPTIENYEKNIKNLEAKNHENQSIKSTSINTVQLGSENRSQIGDSDRQKKDVDSNDHSEAEKQAIMERMKNKDEKPAQELKLRGQRTVKDPVTNSDVIISDAQFDTNQGSSCSSFSNHELRALVSSSVLPPDHLSSFVLRMSSLPQSRTFSSQKF